MEGMSVSILIISSAIVNTTDKLARLPIRDTCMFPFWFPCFQLYSGMHVFQFVFLHSKVVGAIEYIKMYYTRTALLGGSPLDRRCLCSNVPRRESIRLMYTVKCIKMYTRRVY